jgi:D-alanyl-D-alanine carboxypeptidase
MHRGFRVAVALALLVGAPGCGRAGPPSAPSSVNCGQAAYAQAARANAQSLRTLSWAPFRRQETGWEVYAPLVAQEVGTSCAPNTPGFARALAAWQALHGLPALGVMRAETFGSMKGMLQGRRPFVAATARGACPPPPAAADLATAIAREGYGGKVVQLRPGALDAYRRMAAAARAADRRIAADPRNLTIFSAYRSPEYDAARCLRDQNCNGIVRASCSPHRTAVAVDLFLGSAPGFGPDSSADANRLFQSKTPTYAWLVANARRFGFVNYPFEPWHWEWVGG